MNAVTEVFLAIGGLALLLLTLSVLGAGHLHVGHPHIGHVGGSSADADGGGVLTLPVLAGAIGAFGFAGAAAATLVPLPNAASVLLACLVGAVAAVPTGWLAGRLVAAAVAMPTDATLTSADLVGATGVVVTDIAADGLGEVRLSVAGQQIKFHARADAPLATGTYVFVIEVPSPTCVLVEPTPRIRLTDPSSKEGQ